MRNGFIIFYKPVIILDVTLTLEYVTFDFPQYEQHKIFRDHQRSLNKTYEKIAYWKLTFFSN